MEAGVHLPLFWAESGQKQLEAARRLLGIDC